MSENLCKICQSHDNCFYESTFKLWCPRFKKKPPTNADRIRAMSDEELAEEIVQCREADLFRKIVLGAKMKTTEEWLDWLKQEVDE